MTLSETAAATHAFLRAIPNSVVCETCIAAYLGVDRYDVLKSIRELIQAGHPVYVRRVRDMPGAEAGRISAAELG